MSQKNKTTSLKNILGFSLVELMVALGIAGAGTLGCMQLQKSQITGQKKTESKYDATSIANSIGTLLLSKEACRATFTGRTFSETPTSLTRIRKYSANNTAVD